VGAAVGDAVGSSVGLSVGDCGREQSTDVGHSSDLNSCRK
jgi:hypothetical protein